MLYLMKLTKEHSDLAEEMATPEDRENLVTNIVAQHDLNKDGIIDEEEFYATSGAPRPEENAEETADHREKAEL
jgi:hypothetical protein